MSKLKHPMKVNHYKIKKTALLFLTICCYQNKKAILFCFLLKVDTKIMIFRTFTKILKAILISQKNYP